MIRFFSSVLAALVIWGGPVLGQDLRPIEDSIPAEVEQIYQKGLKFLVNTQTAKGNWAGSYGAQPGVVGLAVVAILAHGDDPNSGPYAATVKRALDFILNGADKKTGYLGASTYNHAFATLALAEAYGVVQDERIGPTLQKAVDFILTSQKQNPLGAWRYAPESKDADITVSGAMMVALLAARNAGIGIPEEAIQKGVKFVKSCQAKNGGFGYINNQDPTTTRAGIGVLVLALAKEKKSEAFANGGKFLSDEGSRSRAMASAYAYYHEYYVAQALFHYDESVWMKWNVNNIKRMAAQQGADGSWKGMDPALSTSMALLSLAVNYRFLPIYEK